MPRTSETQGTRRSRRGFAAMDPEERRAIASRGGQHSHGGYGSEHEDYDEDESRYGRRSDYEEEDHYRPSGRGRRGFAAMDPERQREIASRGGRASGGFARWDPEDLREVASRGGRASGGFARWDPEDVREVASRGGRASGGFARWDPEDLREVASRGGRHSHGGRPRYEEEDDEYRPRSHSRSGDYEEYEEPGRRYEDYDEAYEGSRGHWEEEDSPRRSYGRSRRGFAAMDPERQREIASRGGRSSHRYD